MRNNKNKDSSQETKATLQQMIVNWKKENLDLAEVIVDMTMILRWTMKSLEDTSSNMSNVEIDI